MDIYFGHRHIGIHPIRRIWIIYIHLVTTFLKWKLKTPNVKYLTPNIFLKTRKRWNHLPPSGEHWGWVEVFGHLWGYSYEYDKEDK